MAKKQIICQQCVDEISNAQTIKMNTLGRVDYLKPFTIVKSAMKVITTNCIVCSCPTFAGYPVIIEPESPAYSEYNEKPRIERVYYDEQA